MGVSYERGTPVHSVTGISFRVGRVEGAGSSAQGAELRVESLWLRV